MRWHTLEGVTLDRVSTEDLREIVARDRTLEWEPDENPNVTLADGIECARIELMIRERGLRG